LLLGTSPVQADSCQFILGFATLASEIPQVGQCQDNQTFAANGDALQHTTGGLLVWRKADNFTAFTNGYQSWVNGPGGLELRLNSQRFPWEPNPDGLPVAPDASIPAAPLAVALNLTNADDGMTFNVLCCQVIQLTLTAGSGMQPWQIAPPDGSILTSFPPATAAAPAQTVAAFQVIGTGQTAISATDRPACAPGQACPQFIQAFKVNITASAARAA